MNISYKQQTIVHNGVIGMESLPCSKSVLQLEWFLSPWDECMNSLLEAAAKDYKGM